MVTQWHEQKHKDYAEKNGILAIEGRDGQGLGRDKIHFNENSGAQAINLAYLWNAIRLILLGFDMQNTGGKAHFFGEHPPHLAQANYAVYVERFTRLAADLRHEGVEVINCSRETALYQFKRATLGEVYGQA